MVQRYDSFPHLFYFLFQMFDQSKEVFRNTHMVEKNFFNRVSEFKSFRKKILYEENCLLFNFKKKNFLKIDLKNYFKQQENESMQKIKKSVETLIRFRKKKLFLNIYTNFFKLNLYCCKGEKIFGFFVQNNSLRYSKFVIANNLDDFIKSVSVIWNLVIYFIFFQIH